MTRLYLPSSGAAEISPAPYAGWDIAADIPALACGPTPTGTPELRVERMKTLPGTVTCLLAQHVSPPLGAQVVGGAVKAQVRAMQFFAASTGGRPCLRIRLVSGDGAAERGVLLDQVAAAPLTVDVYTNTPFAAGEPLTPVAAEAGDRLVVELGYQSDRPNADRHCGLALGDGGEADLPEDSAATDPLNPWVEFSQALIFQGAGSPLLLRRRRMAGRLLL